MYYKRFEECKLEMVGWNAWNRAHGLRRYDVGVDANGYAPVTVADVLKFFASGL